MAIGYNWSDYILYGRMYAISSTELVDSKLGDTLAVFRFYRKRCVADIKELHPEAKINSIDLERRSMVKGNKDYDVYLLKVLMI